MPGTFANPLHRAMHTLLLATVVATIAACGNDRRQAGDDAATAPAATDTPCGGDATAPPAGEADGDAATPAAAPLPQTRLLQVVVEGQTEQRSARLFQSPQGYSLYVLPQVGMTQEEPCCDLAHATFIC